jgi:hypothetical protein
MTAMQANIQRLLAQTLVLYAKIVKLVSMQRKSDQLFARIVRQEHTPQLRAHSSKMIAWSVHQVNMLRQKAILLKHLVYFVKGANTQHNPVQHLKTFAMSVLLFKPHSLEALLFQTVEKCVCLVRLVRLNLVLNAKRQSSRPCLVTNHAWRVQQTLIA